MTRRIILDCDPGHDDAVAIMFALGSPDIELAAITTVGGNQTIDKVTRNARGILALCGREEVPVYRGAERPLLRQVETAPSIHGETGLDGVELPIPTVAERPQRAAQAIVEIVRESEPGSITLVGTGPLTNLALAARLEPAIVSRVREVVIMGGGIYEGNWTAAAEFNIWVDPEAARIVFDEPWRVTMVGLDVTHRALATSDVVDQAARINTPTGKFFVDLMRFFRVSNREAFGFADPPVHDPCTIAYLVDPAVVVTKAAPVAVETRGELTAGATVVDLRAPAPANCNTRVATQLDRERFWELVLDAIARL
jgi:purine nucleosidase